LLCVRICLVYDCLFPDTVGGAERWYRNVAERLVQDGHEVTYLTMRQWDPGEEPDVAGVRVIAVAPRMPLYAGDRRRVLPPLVFGLGVLRRLIRDGRRYDVVHTASFPYFSLLAAALVRPLARYRLVVDWHELWTRDYWREYLGPLGGWVGWQVQRLCLRVSQRAFCFSRLVERRLLAEGVRGEGDRARRPVRGHRSRRAACRPSRSSSSQGATSRRRTRLQWCTGCRRRARRCRSFAP